VPQTHAAVVVLLGLWVGVAGAYAGAVRFEDAAPEHRLVHGLAAASLGCFFLAYHVLLMVCLISPVGGALLVSPAVALCLLLTLVVAGHGFLKFHFGGWYTAIAVLVVALAIGVAGFTGYRHQLNGLDYGGKLFDLELADFQMEAAEGGESKELLSKLQFSYDRLHNRYTALYPLVEPGQKGPIERKNLSTVPTAKTEQQELRLAMKDLEDKRLDRWKMALVPDKKGKPKLAIVTATGGGSRSAIWTAYTLAKLERELGAANIKFPSNVRLITGASGGMLGAAYYTATLPGPQGHGFKSEADVEAFARKVSQDALTPVCQRLVFFDLPGVFVPGGTAHDRGEALENAWTEYLDGALDTSFAGLAKGEAEGWRPSLVLSPMLVEDGRRVLFSNLYLSPLTETTGSFLTADTAAGVQAAKSKQTPRPKGRFLDWPRYSVTGMEFFQMFPDTWSSFKLGTAVRLNASFPYVSPIAALPTNPPRHLVDAGYYDNYGVNLAAWWIYQNYDWLADNTSGIALIQIRDVTTERKRVSPVTRPEDHKVWDLERGLEGIIGPLTGAGSAFQATASFRNDEQLQVLHDWFNDAPPARPFFTTVVFECQASLALSWYLSDSDIAEAMKGFGQGSANEFALTKLREWFKSE
ncbi:MAG TPA: hypothetical protein VE988_11255, partial [Gemmataceae bacterium]|nr:hypothetical protein [Gemmataceae bacterium]